MHFYLLLFTLTLSGCAKHRPQCLCISAPHDQPVKPSNEKESKDDVIAKDPRDPLESFNRAMFSFNNALDHTLFRPFIGFYRVMPLCIKNRITSVMDTIETPMSMANCVFQGKIHDFLAHTARLFFNLTFGLGGLFDFASVLKIQPQRQDFGKTLQTILKVPPGPFLVIPLLGPSSLRDAIGQAVDCTLLPTTYYDKTALAYYPASYLITQAKITSIQYDLGETFDDAYEALRNAYLMSRGDDGDHPDTLKDTQEKQPDLLGDDGDHSDALSKDTQEKQPDLLGDDGDHSDALKDTQEKQPDLLGDDGDHSDALKDTQEKQPDLLD